jgi:hypothetical protein
MKTAEGEHTAERLVPVHPALGAMLDDWRGHLFATLSASFSTAHRWRSPSVSIRGARGSWPTSCSRRGSRTSFRRLPFEALDGDHGQLPVVKRLQDAIQRGLIGKSPFQDTFCFPEKAGEVTDLHPRHAIRPLRVHASLHADSVGCRSPHSRLIAVFLPRHHRSASMFQRLPTLPGTRVSHNGPKKAHSCQCRIRRLKSEQSGTSALALLGNFQTSLGRHFRQSLLCARGSEQRDAPTFESLAGDTHELLERLIAGVAE